MVGDPAGVAVDHVADGADGGAAGGAELGVLGVFFEGRRDAHLAGDRCCGVLAAQQALKLLPRGRKGGLSCCSSNRRRKFLLLVCFVVVVVVVSFGMVRGVGGVRVVWG